nr:MAG TPA: acid stress chaperone [Caudoviricetes sp.]
MHAVLCSQILSANHNSKIFWLEGWYLHRYHPSFLYI